MSLYNLQAEVHKKTDWGAYRVKVLILNPDIGMYINGNLVTPPNDEYPEWLVQTPKVRNSKAKIVEFDGKSPLWKEYKQACIDVVQEHIRLEELDSAENNHPIGRESDQEFGKKLMDDIDKMGY